MPEVDRSVFSGVPGAARAPSADDSRSDLEERGGAAGSSYPATFAAIAIVTYGKDRLRFDHRTQGATRVHKDSR